MSSTQILPEHRGFCTTEAFIQVTIKKQSTVLYLTFCCTLVKCTQLVSFFTLFLKYIQMISVNLASFCHAQPIYMSELSNSNGTKAPFFAVFLHSLHFPFLLSFGSSFFQHAHVLPVSVSTLGAFPRQCLTCGLREACTFFEANISPDAAHAILHCKGKSLTSILMVTSFHGDDMLMKALFSTSQETLFTLSAFVVTCVTCRSGSSIGPAS